jgi:hypothetical protein
MRRIFRSRRIFGPFIYSKTESHAFTSDDDIRRVANKLVSRTPAKIKRVEYMDYFEEPSIYIDFEIPSSHPKTKLREYFSSSLTADARSGGISELSIRFPGIDVDDALLDDVTMLLDYITPSIYRTRVQIHDDIEGKKPEYHPHVHYSETKRGSSGPYLPDEVLELNMMIKAWYSQVEELFI